MRHDVLDPAKYASTQLAESSQRNHIFRRKYLCPFRRCRGVHLVLILRCLQLDGLNVQPFPWSGAITASQLQSFVFTIAKGLQQSVRADQLLHLLGGERCSFFFTLFAFWLELGTNKYTLKPIRVMHRVIVSVQSARGLASDL